MKIGDRVKIVHFEKFMTPEMKSYCGKYATIVNIFVDSSNYTYYLLDIDDQTYTWTKETLKIVNNMRKVGDKVKIKSLDWYNQNKNSCGHIHVGNEYFVSGMVPYLGKVATITRITEDGRYIINICPEIYTWTDGMFESDILTIPEGYTIDRVEGDTIFLKRSGLPKTWKECVESLKSANYIDDYSNVTTVATCGDISERDHNLIPEGLGKPMLALMQLLVCREVYRQGWKPNLNNNEGKYCIINIGKELRCVAYGKVSSILSFQSEEVRDEFLKNFRDLIEEAKELI